MNTLGPYKSPRPPKAEIDRAIKLASLSVGIHEDHIRGASKEGPAFTGRLLAWSILHQAGYGYNAIAEKWGASPNQIHRALERLKELRKPCQSN